MLKTATLEVQNIFKSNNFGYANGTRKEKYISTLHAMIVLPPEHATINIYLY
jgi:hypothetical protein